MYDLWYIYTLSDNGKVFYVGISKNINQRYRNHLSTQDLCTGNIIYWMRRDDKLPGLEILSATNGQKSAAIAETAIIRQLCIMGNKLCNVDINPIYNRIITCNPYPNRERLKRIDKSIVPSILSDAYDRYHKLSFYYNYEQRNRLQYMGYAAITG